MVKLPFGKKHDTVHRTPARSDNDDYSFRRSRTITGSTVSGISSAAEGRGQLRSSRLEEHDLRHHRRRLMLYLVVLSFAIWLLWLSVSNFISRPTSIRIDGQKAATATETSRYYQAAATYLDEHPLTRFYGLFDHDDFSRSLSDQLSEVAEARMQPINPESLYSPSELIIKPSIPVAVWNIDGTQFYVDDKGRSFQTNLASPPLVTVNDRSGLSPKLGVLASSKLLRYIGRLVTLVNAAGVGTIESVELPPNSTREVVLKFKDVPYPVRTHSDRDPAGQAADVASALRFVTKFEIVPQYLDVRVASKAYYR